MSLIDIIYALFHRRRPVPPVVPPPQPPPPPVVLPDAPPPGPQPPPSDIPAQLLAAHNAERARHGLAPYRIDLRLQLVAARHAEWMAANRVMTHMGADGDPFTRISASGYSWSAASENVAEGERDIPEVVAAWMSSPGHRANILGDYVDFGGAVAVAGDGSNYWCCCFGLPR